MLLGNAHVAIRDAASILRQGLLADGVKGAGGAQQAKPHHCTRASVNKLHLG